MQHTVTLGAPNCDLTDSTSAINLYGREAARPPNSFNDLGVYVVVD